YMLMDSCARKYKLLREESKANFLLGLSFSSLNRIPIAKNYTLHALKLAKQLNDSVLIARSYRTLITCLMNIAAQDSNPKKHFDTLLITLKEFEKYIPANDLSRLSQLYDMFSGAYTMNQDLPNAIKYEKKAIDNLAAINSPDLSMAYTNLAGSYLTMLKYDSALVYLKKIDIGSLKESEYDKRILFNNFYRTYKGLGNAELALAYIEKYNEKDLELNEAKNLDIQQLRENFETQKTRQHIEDEKEKAKVLYEQKRNFNLYISGAGFLIFAITAFFIYYRFRTKKEKEKKNLQLLLQNAELTALKAQMNPHFIFNALNSIQHSIVTNNPDEAYRFLSKFSKLIRNILDSSAEQLISLKTEIETLTLYTEIESKRFDNSFTCNFETQLMDTDAEKIMIPPMIIQPFIENAIWHGLMPKDGTKILNIKFLLQNEKTLVVEISDNGIGRQKAKEIAVAKNKKHKSRGLDIINERIHLLERTQAFSITIETTDFFDAGGKAAGTGNKITFINTNKANV
ncbi:MAG: histidine kinase, partial [Bacteroidia bacterium]|nr:histidine kinase [Bacteroidia bacterium]